MVDVLILITAGAFCGDDAGPPPLSADPGVARPLLPSGPVPRVDALALLGVVQVSSRPQGSSVVSRQSRLDRSTLLLVAFIREKCCNF